MVIEISVEGAEDLEQAMKALPFRLQKEVLGPGCVAGCRVISKNLKRTIPVKTGALKNSIRVFAIKDWLRGKEIKGGAGLVRVGGAGARHAHLVEFGTSKAPGKHYLRRAAEANKIAQHKAFIQKSSLNFKKTVESINKGKVTRRLGEAIDNS